LQPSPAANLPPEILLSIFAYFTEEAPDYLESRYGDATLGKSALPALALVCVQWSQVANSMLYQHGRVADLKKLNSFLKTLKLSDEIEQSVKSFTYRVPKDLEQDCPKRKAKLERELLAAICDRLKSTSLNLKVSQMCIERLLHSSFSPACLNLTSLHLLASPTSSQFGDILPHYITLPKLESLTLEYLVLDDTMVWPEMPALQCLRLVSCALFDMPDMKTQMDQMHRLTRLELHHVHYQEDMFQQLLRLCAPTLEHLVVLDVSGPMLSATMDDLRFCAVLKKLCIGPLIFPAIFQTYSLSTKFPPTLEEFTLFELAQPIFSWWPPEIIPNTQGMKSLLKSCDDDGSTSLKRIHVRGREEWADCEEELAKMSQRLGIEFTLQTFKCTCPPEDMREPA
jgi:hypothetical protein